MKAISLILQCYNRRFELLRLEPEVNQIKEYIDTVKKASKDIEMKEKRIQAYLEGRRLTQSDIDLATNPEAVF